MRPFYVFLAVFKKKKNFKTSPQLLLLFRIMMQRCFAVELQKERHFTFHRHWGGGGGEYILIFLVNCSFN